MVILPNISAKWDTCNGSEIPILFPTRLSLSPIILDFYMRKSTRKCPDNAGTQTRQPEEICISNLLSYLRNKSSAVRLSFIHEDE